MKHSYFSAFFAVLFLSVFLPAEDKAVPATAPSVEPAASPSAAEPEKTPLKAAKPLLTRHGFVYSAEISKKKPVFQFEEKEDQPKFANPVWAEVMLKLPKFRGISRFDYELKTNSGAYPCLAVALENEPYSQKRELWTIEAKKEQTGKFVRILFAFPSADLQYDASMQNFTLELKTAETNCPPPPLSFRILPDSQPLSGDPQKIGENGNYGLSCQELADLEKAKTAPVEEKKPTPAPEEKPAAESPAGK